MVNLAEVRDFYDELADRRPIKKMAFSLNTRVVTSIWYSQEIAGLSHSLVSIVWWGLLPLPCRDAFPMWVGVAVWGANLAGRRLRGADLFAAWGHGVRIDMDREVWSAFGRMTPAASVRSLTPRCFA